MGVGSKEMSIIAQERALNLLKAARNSSLLFSRDVISVTGFDAEEKVAQGFPYFCPTINEQSR